MRTTWAFRAISSLVFLPLLVALPCRSQQTASSSPEPADPKALMMAALKLNNLAAPDVKPWHIKATFQLFDDQGAVTDEGSYEEFWASPFQFKRMFIGKNFSQTAYGSKQGLLISNAKGETPSLLLAARNNLVSPMPFDFIIQHTTYESKPLNSGSLKLDCAIPTATSPGAPPDTSAYCFDADEPVLRIAARPSTSDQTFHNRLIRVEDRAIATDLKIKHNGKATVALHVDEAAVLDPVDEAVFTPPPDAVPMPIIVSGGIIAGMLEYKVAPEYPIAARIARISGTVVLECIIRRDGKVRVLKALSGPEALQGTAIQTVQQWRYRPYLLNGKPVEVRTTINVIFQLGQN
ncbi:MAG: energy transducer TonB [Acidobacteriota bacterium]